MRDDVCSLNESGDEVSSSIFGFGILILVLFGFNYLYWRHQGLKKKNEDNKPTISSSPLSFMPNSLNQAILRYVELVQQQTNDPKLKKFEKAIVQIQENIHSTEQEIKKLGNLEADSEIANNIINKMDNITNITDKSAPKIRELLNEYVSLLKSYPQLPISKKEWTVTIIEQCYTDRISHHVKLLNVMEQCLVIEKEYTQSVNKELKIFSK